MTSISPKGAVASYPRSLSSIAVTVGGLAMFLILASLLLVSSPIGTTVHEYFVGVDSSTKLDAARMQDYQKLFEVPQENVDVVGKNDKSGSDFGAPLNSTDVDSVDNTNPLPIETNPRVVSSDSELEVGAVNNNSSVASKSVENGEVEISHNEDNGKDENSSDKGKGDESSLSSNFVENGEIEKSRIEDNGKVENSIEKDKGDESNLSSSSDLKSKSDQDMSNMVSDAIKSGADDSDCYLYHGSWFYDPLGPSYTNNTCPVLTQMQNCQGNGRPDKDYENWRWKPSKCDLPRFDARKFLELMRGKTIAFIGDSVARNQMESMLCLLWQVEVPKNRGNKRMQRYYFRSTSTMVVRIWSSWLVHKTTEPIGFAPEGITKLHLDAPDEDFMNYIQDFNVVVLSSGHWFAKQSVYVLNNEIVGGQLWWPDKSVKMKVNNVEAFGISVETALTAIGTNPNFTGLAIVRTYSPDHYEGGAWNTGGSCTGKIKPLEPGHLVENGFTDIMHKKQVTGFERAIKKKNNKAKLKLMDITEAFSYRHDGHPGPYRNPDPNKITKRGPDGKPPPQDCLHWCMPGAVDTWNELVLEIIRREYEGSQNIT